jgi:hypothetical protein
MLYLKEQDILYLRIQATPLGFYYLACLLQQEATISYTARGTPT